MFYLEYARKRVRAFLRQIDRLLESEFPYPQSELALQRLRLWFKERLLGDLDLFTDESDETTVKETCIWTLTELFDYLPILGFLLRSTNVRNAFEAFYPLLRLARQLLKPSAAESKRTTELIISSEWDYSPLAYSRIRRLPGFILIGLPAPESENPLLIPLAGHELGHSVWTEHNLEVEFTPAIKQAVMAAIMAKLKEYKSLFPGLVQTEADLINNEDARPTWSQAVDWALDQAEETFCDFLGLRVFGRSYLCAFAYLLAPRYDGERSVHYPTMRTRVTNLVRGAQTDSYSIEVPPGYQEAFEDEEQPALREADTFRLSLADMALSKIVDDLIAKAHTIVSSAHIVKRSSDEANRISGHLKRVVPAEKAKSLADILNAAWQVSEDLTLWENVPQIRGRRDKKEEALRELVLKNIEVFEYERVLEEYERVLEENL